MIKTIKDRRWYCCPHCGKALFPVRADWAAGDAEKLSRDRTRLTLLRQRYAQFSKAAGLRTQYERTEVAGFGERRKTTASLLAAPQGNLVQEGEVFNPETAVDSLLKRLENSPGMADNIAVLRYYAEQTDFVRTDGMKSPISYDPNADVIRYNLNELLPRGADRDGILIHEISHRADHLMYEASENLIWQKAIAELDDLVAGRKEEIQSWFATGGKYADDAFLSDIASAIFRGDIDVPYSHSPEYWAYPLNREREIFANLSVISSLHSSGSAEFKGLLQSLYEAFVKIC